MSAPLTWRVLGMVPHPSNPASMVGLRTAGGLPETCGHYHGTREEAEACPWEPANPPELYAGIVRQVRDERPDIAAGEHRFEQGAMPW